MDGEDRVQLFTLADVSFIALQTRERVLLQLLLERSLSIQHAERLGWSDVLTAVQRISNKVARIAFFHAARAAFAGSGDRVGAR
jgi:hypothetical protein